MGVLKKNDTKKIFAEAGCWYKKGIYDEINLIVYDMLIDISKRSKNILTTWKKRKITSAALELAYDQHKQSNLTEITNELIEDLKGTLEKKRKEVETFHGRTP